SSAQGGLLGTILQKSPHHPAKPSRPLKPVYRRFRTTAERARLYPRMRPTAPPTRSRIEPVVVVSPLDCEGYCSRQRKAIPQIESAASTCRAGLCCLPEGLVRTAVSKRGRGCAV